MNKEIIKKICLSPSFDYDKNPWYVNIFNGFCGKIDIQTNNQIVTEFVGLDESGYGKAVDIVEANNKAYIFPRKTLSQPEILVRMNDGLYKTLLLEKLTIREELKNCSMFERAFLIDDYIFAFGLAYPAVVRIDTCTDEVKYSMNWVEKIEGDQEKSLCGYFVSRQIADIGEFLYMPFECVSSIIKINKKTLENEVIRIKTNSTGFSCTVKLDSEHLLLSGAGDDSGWLYTWNLTNNNIESVCKVEELSDSLPVLNLLRVNDEIYIFPRENVNKRKLDVLSFNYKSRVLSHTGLLDESSENELNVIDSVVIVHVSLKSDDTILFITGKDLAWHEYNIRTKEHIKKEMFVDDKDEWFICSLKEYYGALTECRIPINEKDYGLDSFVALLGE